MNFKEMRGFFWKSKDFGDRNLRFSFSGFSGPFEKFFKTFRRFFSKACRDAFSLSFLCVQYRMCMQYKVVQKQAEHLCLQCGEAIYGRPDKKFCNDHCRSEWHNHRGRQSLKMLKMRYMHALEKNRSILLSCLERGLRSVSVEELALLGFRFDCVSSHFQINGHNEYGCLDIRYRKTAAKVCRIEQVPVML
jgi:predicted nucleic acid-binding Zn ribbon protein